MFIDARTKGMVLASYDLNGPDKIYICYTLDLGKIEIIARGVKKSSSRLAPHLETFVISDLLMILTAKNNILRSCVAVKNFANIKRNMDLYFAASYILEVIDKLTAFNDPEPRIFFLLLDSLNMLNGAKNKNDIEFVIICFQFKFLDISGLRPRFDECIFCRKDMNGEEMFFSFKHGSAICKNCRKKGGDSSLKITDKLRQALEIIFKGSCDESDKRKLFADKETVVNLRKIGSFLILSHLGKKIRSEAYI